MQVGGEGGADIRIVNCFVAVFLSFSLLAFTLAFPGFSAKKKEDNNAERCLRDWGEMDRWLTGQGLTWTDNQHWPIAIFLSFLFNKELNYQSFITGYSLIWLFCVDWPVWADNLYHVMRKASDSVHMRGCDMSKCFSVRGDNKKNSTLLLSCWN